MTAADSLCELFLLFPHFVSRYSICPTVSEQLESRPAVQQRAGASECVEHSRGSSFFMRINGCMEKHRDKL